MPSADAQGRQTCQAVPHEGHRHKGKVRGYVRVCPIGHFRPCTVCSGCAQGGAVICDDCDGPALVILMDIWAVLVKRDSEMPQ